MKYSIVLIIACIPLAALTVWHTTDSSIQSPETSQRETIDVQEMKKSAEAATARVEGDAAAFVQWVELHLAGPQRQGFVDPKTDAARAVVMAWRELHTANELAEKVTRAATLPSVVEQDQRRRVDGEVKALEDFVFRERRLALANVKGADRLFLAVDSRIEQLKREQLRLESKAKIELALDAVAERLSHRKLKTDEEALALLDKEPIKSARDLELSSRISELREITRYRLEGRNLLARKPRIPADRNLLRAYEGFFRRHPKPPTRDEQRGFEVLSEHRSKLEFEVGLADIVESTEWGDTLSRAERLARHPEGGRRKARIAQQLTDWIWTKGIPEQAIPDWLFDKQEAITKSGEHLIGEVFVPVGDDQWRFWKDARARDGNPLGDMQIAKNDLISPPGEILYLRLAREYNLTRETAMHSSDSKDAWQSLVDNCVKTQAELIAYRRRLNLRHEIDEVCGKWTFDRQATVARQLIQVWPRYRALIETSQISEVQ